MVGKKLFLLILFLWVEGCSTSSVNESEQWQTDFIIDRDSQSIKQELLFRYADWYDVPYRYGGLSKQGIDCSGFVYLTYKDVFATELPRTSRQQANTGRLVSRNRLRAGDLVFFKTGKNQNHVGIFIENQKFLHVSTKKGVILSSLSNRYWSARYWKAVRILSEVE